MNLIKPYIYICLFFTKYNIYHVFNYTSKGESNFSAEYVIILPDMFQEYN